MTWNLKFREFEVTEFVSETAILVLSNDTKIVSIDWKERQQITRVKQTHTEELAVVLKIIIHKRWFKGRDYTIHTKHNTLVKLLVSRAFSWWLGVSIKSGGTSVSKPPILNFSHNGFLTSGFNFGDINFSVSQYWYFTDYDKWDGLPQRCISSDSTL